MASKKSSFKIGVSGLAFKSKVLASDKSDLVRSLTFDFLPTKLLLCLPQNARAETPMCIELLCTGLAVCIEYYYVSCIIKRINILIRRSAVVLISSAQSLNLKLHKTFRSTFPNECCMTRISINNDLSLKGKQITELIKAQNDCFAHGK